MRKDVYFSTDIEADGDFNPLKHSMLSFGMSAFATFDGTDLVRLDPEARTDYHELKPLHDTFQQAALDVAEKGGISRARLVLEGEDPTAAMTANAAWVRRVAAELGGKPVFVAYPLGYDVGWMSFMYNAFAESGSPFGHSSHFDLKTAYAVKAGVPIAQAVKGRMPRHLFSKRPHTHHGLDDAVEQADLGYNLMAWHPKTQGVTVR
jgi:hypothetical protein